jgi:hypothetical protein
MPVAPQMCASSPSSARGHRPASRWQRFEGTEQLSWFRIDVMRTAHIFALSHMRDALVAVPLARLRYHERANRPISWYNLQMIKLDYQNNIEVNGTMSRDGTLG